MSAEAKAEAPGSRLDRRTAEVLRCLDRAKVTIAKTQTSPNIEATTESLESTTRVIEAVVAVAREMLADFQRGQDRAVSDLRVSADGLMRQTDVLAAWRGWWTRHVAAWAVVLALVLAAGVGLAWRAHALAQSTHDILLQILENQTKAQAAKAVKRR
jgi:hypothetical protein